ncbi:MAG TPA: YegP family protein, partial [Anaerolineales bacterium]|nr:YegP family protein [Anaerolineales bacterium]
QNGIESVRKNAGRMSNYEERVGKNKKPYFVLMAANKEIIGQSQMYASTTNMRNGMASVKSNARSASVEDTTVKK